MIKILKKDSIEPNIIIGLFTDYDVLGVLSGFDGNIISDELFNVRYATYTNNNIITLYFNIDEKFKKDIIQIDIDWGNGTSSLNVGNNNFSKDFYVPSDLLISVVVTTTFGKYFYYKQIKTGVLDENTNFENFSLTNGLTSLESQNNMDGHDLNFIGMGKSRLQELRKYGTEEFENVIYGETDGINWIRYELDGLTYEDYEDGITKITGNTGMFTMEQIINQMLTRNEHFLGFVDEPTITSDVFIDRGKQGVLEKNLRLCEIDNVGEIMNYGNGYFKIKKQ